jgi:hypothetical protein
MGIKGSAGLCHFLHMFGSSRRGTLLNRGLWRLHYLSSLLKRRFIGSNSLNKGSIGRIPFWVLFITENEIKSRNLALVKKKNRDE